MKPRRLTLRDSLIAICLWTADWLDHGRRTKLKAVEDLYARAVLQAEMAVNAGDTREFAKWKADADRQYAAWKAMKEELYGTNPSTINPQPSTSQNG